MEFEEGKKKFIQAWGTVGNSWGVNRTMAQIHALLLIANKPLSSDDVIEELQISGGNANMNLRKLIEWGLIYKELVPGNRRDFYVAEKDMWEVVKKVIIQRKKRELEPVIKMLDEVVDIQDQSPDAQEFVKVMREIKLFSNKADSTLDHLINADSNWFVGTFMKMIR